MEIVVYLIVDFFEHRKKNEFYIPSGISLWLFWKIFVQKVLEYKYQLQMNLIDLLDIKRPQKVIKRPKKALKVVKAKSKARSTMV